MVCGWRDERRKDLQGEAGKGKGRRGKVALKSEKICLVVLSQTHTTVRTLHTHRHTQGVTLFSITCDSCCPPDPCSYCGNGDRNYGGADR